MRSTRSRRRRPFAVAAVLVFTAGAAAPRILADGDDRQQQGQPTFRTQVNVVQVDARVTDQQGRFVPDLRQEDFEVLENGRPQRIATTQVVNIPVERVDAPLFAAGSAVVKPDVETNARPFDGRLYLIILDDLQVSSTRTILAQRIARDFIEKNVAPNDMAAVIPTSGNRQGAQELTRDRRLLLQAVDRFVGRKVISPSAALQNMGATAESAVAVGQAAPTDPAAPQRMYNARATLETLGDVARFAGRIRDRRKTVVYISEGIDYDFGAVTPMRTATEGQPLGMVHTEGASREVRDRLRDFVEAANRGNITLYAFDPRVYTHGGDDLVDIAAGQPDNMSAYEGDNVKTTRLMDDVMASQDNLRTMATETGGFAVTGSLKALQGGFERVRNETSNYYIIGYYPANEARDGKFRKIEVRVKKAGLKVEARKGYVAPKGNAPVVSVDAKAGTSPAVYDALASALPVSGLTLTASAAAFKGAAKEASVVVIVQAPGKDLQFVQKGDRFEDSVELSVVAIDKIGRTRGGERTVIDMPLSQKMQAFVGQTGLVFPIRLTLPAGQYQLRIAGRDAGSEKVGSVHYELEVPDFTAAPLAMSGLVLTAAEAGQVPNPRPDEDLKKLLPASPITTREFGASDELAILAEVYDNKIGQPHKVRLTTTVLADDGRAIVTQNDERSTSEFEGTRGGFGYTPKIPLRGLAAGLYVLRVEARSTLDADTVVTREIQFRVR